MSTTALLTSLGLIAPITPATAQSAYSMSELATTISEAEVEINEVLLQVGQLQENVNQRFVDLSDAYTLAEFARQRSVESREALVSAQEQLSELQSAVDELARTHFRFEGISSIVDLSSADARAEFLERTTFLKQRSKEEQVRIDAVDRARTRAANENAKARAAYSDAELSVEQAEQAQQEAQAALDENTRLLEELKAELDSLIDARNEAEAQLAEQRGVDPSPITLNETSSEIVSEEGSSAGGLETLDGVGGPEEVPGADEAEEVGSTQPVHGQLDSPYPSLDETEESSAENGTASGSSSGNFKVELQGPSSEESTSGTASATSTTTVASTTKAAPSAPAATATTSAQSSGATTTVILDNETAEPTTSASPTRASASSQTVSAQEAVKEEPTSVVSEVEEAAAAPNTSQVETVIARAMAQLGTPYVWGGGDANGPTRGVNGGSIYGFDCSGLVLYAFAGVGISLPHYTGYQYQRGTKVASQNAQRGDLLFWGHNGSQHVAIYLGNGQMIEAPYTGATVRVTSVRWGGMTPYAVRLL